MNSSPSSSAQAARVRLGTRLRKLRVSAGLTGRAFAERAEWRSAANVTKIEKGQYAITADTVQLWCRICGASQELTAELLAEQANVADAWATHMELNRGGLKARQERLRGIYWQVAVQRVYQTRVVPGLLQTADMISFLLDRVRIDQHIEIDDVAEAVAARLARQECLKRPDARWLFILEEDVLWYRSGPLDTHRGQLTHLLEVMRRPTVFLGIIPREIDRRGVITGESFTMDDTSLVSVELTSGHLNITSPPEVRLYLEMWARLESIAVYGKQAQALILDALRALDALDDGG
ncbi:MAG: helix-turn-helix domain-containing protein [Sciscionella sp.]